MPTVYVPQLPSKLDQATKVWVPIADLRPAEKFGKIVIMLPPQITRMSVDQLSEVICEKMEGFTQDDYVMGAGSPLLIGLSNNYAMKATEGFGYNFLQWDKRSSEYINFFIRPFYD